MKVIDIKKPVTNLLPYKLEYFVMSTGHKVTLIQFNDGKEEMNLHTKTGKKVKVNSTTWKLAEKAIWNTNSTRTKF